ncbi:LiaF transmembrane domain-containing protein [Oxalobacteraceae bacterium A2-2]
MKQQLALHWRKQLVWGLIFIALGTLILLDRLHVLEFDFRVAQLWHYWPVILVVIGLTQMIPPTNTRYFLNGLWKLFFAAWWWVSFEHVWGLNFGDTWPALIVACGVGMVLEPLLARQLDADKEQA